MTKTILVLAANPKNTVPLRLDQEIREITNGLERAQKRDEFILKQKLAARSEDVRRAMLDYKPNIVHFCGHGSGEEGIAFEDESGQAKLVNTDALAGFFELFADKVECVVLNACYSEVQAEAIAKHIPYVIGMSKAIGDSAAIEFAVAFYDALGAGKDVDFAYKLACNAIQWAGLPEHLTPVLKKHSIEQIDKTASKMQEERVNESTVASMLDDLRDKSLSPTITDIVVERSITLQKCPDMLRGWKSEEVEFDHHEDERFKLPDDFTNAYERYFKDKWKKRDGGSDDNTIMLRNEPVASTDRPKLLLETKSNLYSLTQFYWNEVLLDEVRYNKALNDLLERGEISFPHNLCMHLVVVTNDDQTLLTLRSRKVGTHQNTWSCSIEEGLKPDDLNGDSKTIVARWISRALFEELGVRSDYCKELSVLSVFLEGVHRLNISLCGYALLDLTQKELSERILLPRPDNELAARDYLSLDQVAKELRNPTRLYHPTSRYRMLMALLHRYGEKDFPQRYARFAK